MRLLDIDINKLNMRKGGPGSGRHPENKSDKKPVATALKKPLRTAQQAADEATRLKQRIRGIKPTGRATLGRKLGHVINSTAGGALRGGLIGSLAGPMGTKFGTAAGSMFGGYQGLRNSLRNRIPNITTGQEATQNMIDAGVAYGISRLPFRSMGRAGRRMLARRT